MKNLYVSVFIFALKTIFALNLIAAGNAAKGQGSYAVCLACHGSEGMGNIALNAPQIAGQSIWYLKRQLKNFKKGIRGADAKDTYGMQMRPMALTLRNDDAINDMATYISSMPLKPVSATIKGDLDAGKKSYMLCQSCHGANGEGNKALNAPRLAGQHDWYLARQLKNFKEGIRGTKAGDLYGAQMRPMAMALSNEETIRNISAYIATFKIE